MRRLKLQRLKARPTTPRDPSAFDGFTNATPASTAVARWAETSQSPLEDIARAIAVASRITARQPDTLVVSPAVYARIEHKLWRRQQRLARSARRKRKKIRGW